MKSKFLPLALTVAILAGPAWSRAAGADQSTDEQRIRKIEREWIDAIVTRNGAYLQMIEAPDFTMTGPDGKVLSKKEDIKTTTSGAIVFEQIKIDRVKVRLYGDAAIANGLGTIKAHKKDKDLSGKYTWTDAFVKLNGEWKAVGAHVTAVGPEKK